MTRGPTAGELAQSATSSISRLVSGSLRWKYGPPRSFCHKSPGQCAQPQFSNDVQTAGSQARKQRSEDGSSLWIEVRSVVDYEIERLSAKLGSANSIQRGPVGLIHAMRDEDASIALTGGVFIQRGQPARRKLDTGQLLGGKELVVQNDTATPQHADVNDPLDKPGADLRKMRLDELPVLAQDKAIAYGPPLLQQGRQAQLDLHVPVVDQVIVDPGNLAPRLEAV